MSRKQLALIGLVVAFSFSADATSAPAVSSGGFTSADAGGLVPSGRAVPSARFGWPVSPHRVVRRFEAPQTRWGPGHRGVDLATTSNADVVAPSAGVATFSGVVAGRGVLTLLHSEGFSTTYEPVKERIAKGTRVERGARIATLDAGHCNDSPCLHWGYRVGKDEYRDPLTLVRGARPILLPPLT